MNGGGEAIRMAAREVRDEGEWLDGGAKWGAEAAGSLAGPEGGQGGEDLAKLSGQARLDQSLIGACADGDLAQAKAALELGAKPWESDGRPEGLEGWRWATAYEAWLAGVLRRMDGAGRFAAQPSQAAEILGLLLEAGMPLVEDAQIGQIPQALEAMRGGLGEKAARDERLRQMLGFEADGEMMSNGAAAMLVAKWVGDAPGQVGLAEFEGFVGSILALAERDGDGALRRALGWMRALWKAHGREPSAKRWAEAAAIGVAARAWGDCGEPAMAAALLEDCEGPIGREAAIACMEWAAAAASPELMEAAGAKAGGGSWSLPPAAWRRMFEESEAAGHAATEGLWRWTAEERWGVEPGRRLPLLHRAARSIPLAMRHGECRLGRMPGAEALRMVSKVPHAMEEALADPFPAAFELWSPEMAMTFGSGRIGLFGPDRLGETIFHVWAKSEWQPQGIWRMLEMEGWGELMARPDARGVTGFQALAGSELAEDPSELERLEEAWARWEAGALGKAAEGGAGPSKKAPRI